METPIYDEKKIEIKCVRWLRDKFNIDAKVLSMKPLTREEIDTSLGLLGIKFDFKTHDGRIGDSVVFFKLEEIHGSEIYKYADKQLKLKDEDSNKSFPSRLLDEQVEVGITY